MATPNRPPKGSSASQSKTGSQSKQASILGFFQKKSEAKQPIVPKPDFKDGAAARILKTPLPSSDPVEPTSSPLVPSKSSFTTADSSGMSNKENEAVDPDDDMPVRKGRKKMNYAESDNEDVLQPVDGNGGRRRSMKRRKLSPESDDDFEGDEHIAEEVDEDDFIVPDDSDEDLVVRTNKRKRPTPTKRQEEPEVYEDNVDIDMTDIPASTAQQWKYDPDFIRDIAPLPKKSKPKTSFLKSKPRPHETEPESRHPWLANPVDLDRNPVGHPDYDPRTIYVPPLAFSKLSNFEKQYWEIKSKLWDTVVFFKKGKFYELYEQDATIGNQEFDLKLTDRVNMRMVGVPESSIDHWANQFVAKGYKIAKVDQMESQLGKEIRERDEQGKGTKEKIIRRELTSVLTAATLVDGSMLQDDMATYCMAIKEELGDDGVPSFGLAFVDTATAQFELSEFVDDVDMTKFETLIAQIRPRELLLEKGHISAKALRILKNNTGPSTIWTYLKPGKEFWTTEVTEFELRGGAYFVDEEGNEKIPAVLVDSKGKELAISAYGAVVQYLQNLKIDKQIVTLGNVSWYDPIRKATSLVLDGQSLINLEIFANTVDGGPQGTLFNTLNRCVTPFGKRMLKQWVCHPLADSKRINARLDAVESLLAQQSIMTQFSDSLARMPDLERLISRIHAQSIKVPDFIRVLEGFEQIDYTMAMLREIPAGDGVIGQLIASAPDLKAKLDEWKDAFDKDRAISEQILVPAPGVEPEYDESQATVDACLEDLDEFLKDAKKQFGGHKAICYRDNGKEIYQLEIPANMKNVPKEWDQMSATKAVKRYYTPKLRKLVRALQEAKEIHIGVVKNVVNRFCMKFDDDYEMWLLAVKIVAQLDCLISLARASANLGEPACRPVFTDEERTVVEFEDLRHPCMINTVSDFIPNDIKLGGTTPNINLLTGANAAGKSTVLRMTCVAVIMAQVGCYVPAQSARLSPIDRIMSRLGAHDNIFAAQSTFFVELSETKKILSEATPRSLVILDELGRGTSSYDGVAVAQAVLHDVASRIGCVGFFATHYHSLAVEFRDHPEINCHRMAIHVDEVQREVTFLFKLEEGIAEGSFGMHCAHMCGIPDKVVSRAEVAAKQWEHTSRLRESLEKAKGRSYVPLGMMSDVSWMMKNLAGGQEEGAVTVRELDVLRMAIAAL